MAVRVELFDFTVLFLGPTEFTIKERPVKPASLRNRIRHPLSYVLEKNELVSFGLKDHTSS